MKITKIEKLDEKYDRYDLTVGETSNFYANGILIHNTSQRSGYVPVERELKWYEKWLTKFGVKINNTELETVNGTRRVVLQNNTTGYHAPSLREKHFQRIAPLIEEYMIVYYEVVGYEPTGASIMPSHHPSKFKDFKKDYDKEVWYTYGLPKGESEIYVYRICYVLPNGKTFDLSWDEVKEKCTLWNVNHVPEITRIKYVGHLPTSKEEFDSIDDIVEYIDQLSDGKDPIDPRHPREGVCVRINKTGWHTFKNKGWTFKVLEGIAKQEDDYEDLEEES